MNYKEIAALNRRTWARPQKPFKDPREFNHSGPYYNETEEQERKRAVEEAILWMAENQSRDLRERGTLRTFF